VSLRAGARPALTVAGSARSLAGPERAGLAPGLVAAPTPAVRCRRAHLPGRLRAACPRST